MEREQNQQQLDDAQQEQSSTETLDELDSQEKGEVIPGVPIIRDSTPRPVSFEMMTSYSGYFRSLQLGTCSTFPEQAPSAPPLPEELGEYESENELNGEVAISQGYRSQYGTIQSIQSQDQIVQQDAPVISEETKGFPTISPTQLPSSVLPTTNPGSGSLKMTSQQDEQNTDPLPTVKKEGQHIGNGLVQKSPIHWPLVIFAVYLAVLLVGVLAFAVLQGMGFGQDVLTNTFTPLEVPWLVILYGLLGGCVSCLLSLEHLRAPHPPLFVIIIWFVRPYIGAVLAIFAYILLTSGLFITGQNVQRHMTFFWLMGALAGFSEGLLFFRRG